MVRNLRFVTGPCQAGVSLAIADHNEMNSESHRQVPDIIVNMHGTPNGNYG